jgi:serine/threonine protein kinase
LGLEAIHKQGWCHRDLKPSNLLLDSLNAERVRISDLGLVFHANFGNQDLSQGHPVGTSQYIAPDAWNADHKDSPQDDLFSLGCILYEALTGKDALPAKLFASQLHIPTPILDVNPHIDPGLASVVTRLLQQQASRRYATAGEVAAALGALVYSQALSSCPHRPSWPRLTSEAIRQALTEISSFSFGIPEEWNYGPAGAPLGLACRVQLARRMLEACSTATNRLLNLEFEYRAKPRDPVGEKQFRKTVNLIFEEFERAGKFAAERAAGLELFLERIDKSLEVLRHIKSDLDGECIRDVEGDSPEQWTGALARLKLGIREMTERSKFFLEDHQFVSDRMLSLLIELNHGSSSRGLAGTVRLPSSPTDNDH